MRGRGETSHTVAQALAEELRERIRGLVADFLRPFRDASRLDS
jgi:hypothetical protein